MTDKLLEEKVMKLFPGTASEYTFNHLDQQEHEYFVLLFHRLARAVVDTYDLDVEIKPMLIAHIAALSQHWFVIGHNWAKEYGPLW